MDIKEIQLSLFQLIKSRIPADANMPDEIAKLLNISSDSAYRRMRGEKLITFEELYLLSGTFRISLDQLMNIQTGSILFQGNLLNHLTFRFDNYLTATMHNMAYFNSFSEKEYYYLCKDTPLFYHFQFREFAAFKYFFWMGTLIAFPEFRNKKVILEEYPDELWNLGEKILELYNQLDSYEVWNLESLNSTLHQIDYYRDTGKFQSEQDIYKVYQALENMIDHTEIQARLGYKFRVGDPERRPMGKYYLYFNDTVLLDNSMMAVLDKGKIAVQPHTSINYMLTRDVNYCENYFQFVQNLLKRSTKISEVSEKERSRFFRIIRDRIINRKEALVL